MDNITVPDYNYDQTVTYSSVDNSYSITGTSSPSYITVSSIGTSPIGTQSTWVTINDKVDLDDYNNNKIITDGRIATLETENYNLKQQINELKETIKLIGDSLVEYADEHERKKKCTKKKENQEDTVNSKTLK